MKRILNNKKIKYFIFSFICFLVINSNVKAENITCYYRFDRAYNGNVYENQEGTSYQENLTFEDNDDKGLKMVYDKDKTNSFPNFSLNSNMNSRMSIKMTTENKIQYMTKYLNGTEKCLKNLYIIRADIDNEAYIFYHGSLANDFIYNEGKQKFDKYIHIYLVNTSTSTSQKNDINYNTDDGSVNSYKDERKKYSNSDITVTDKNSTTTATGEGCDKIGSIGKYITGFYNLFRYIAPALIIIFSVIDFLGVVFSGEDDKMEKAKKNFIIRLIVGILILIIPFMLEFILSAAGIIDGTIADAACNFLN